MTTDILYFQALICSLKGQLEDIKCINLEMYTKLAVGAVLIFDDVDVNDKDLNSDEASS